jgi:anaerobic ribonucleoside-triphosphate reductase activating protein
MLPFEGGTPTLLSELCRRMDVAVDEYGIEGITFLGGEPLAHARAAAALARFAQSRDLSVMVFTGYTLEQANELSDDCVGELLACTDILVDGLYERDAPDRERRWIGSANQKIHFLTTRHSADDPCWRRPNTLEIRLDATGLSVHGFPAIRAAGLWRELAKRSRAQVTDSHTENSPKREPARESHG